MLVHYELGTRLCGVPIGSVFAGPSNRFVAKPLHLILLFDLIIDIFFQTGKQFVEQELNDYNLLNGKEQ